MMVHLNPNEPRNGIKHINPRSTHPLISHSSTSTTFFAAARPGWGRYQSSLKIRLREAIKVRSECDTHVFWAIKCSNVVPHLVDAPITIEDSGCQTESEGELPTVEELFLEPHLSNLETGVTPVAEGMITDPDTQGHGDNAGDSGDDVMRFAQLPEYGNGNGSGGDDDDDDDDDNNATVVGLQVLKQRKRARSLSIGTTINTFETPNHDTLVKRQRPSLRTGDESVPKRTPTPNPEALRVLEAGTGGTRTRIDNGQFGSVYNGEALDITGGSDASDDGKPADSEGRDDSRHDVGNNEPLERVEPTKTATQPASPLRQSPSYQHGTEDLYELDELHDGIDGGRMVDNDYRTRSPLRATTRQRRTKPLRMATPALSSARRLAAKLVDQPTPDSNDDGISHANKVSEITLRPISTGVVFLVATIQTASGMLKLSCSEPAELIERVLGYAGKVEDITLKPLASAALWQVTGFLHLRHICSDVPRPTPADDTYSFDLRKRARALCSSVVVDAGVANDFQAEGDGVLNDGHRHFHEGGCGDSGSDDEDDGGDGYYDDRHEGTAAGRSNRRWDPLEEQRLLAWRREKMSWKWIFEQFPNRSEGAVRVRWYMLQRSTQKAD